ncbi:MAG: hypothetical protein ACM3XM_17015 [Mycobacterium leprae]
MKDRRIWLVGGILAVALLMLLDIHSNGAGFMQSFVKSLVFAVRQQ